MATSNKVALNLVDIKEAKQLLSMAISTQTSGMSKKHLNVCLHGSPGIGKSSIVAQVAEEFGFTLIDLRLSAMEASDVLGIPYTFNGVMKFSTPEWWPTGDVPTILFLDELKSAPPAVQTAAYRLILDRSIQNGSVLPHNCIIVAAGNLKEDKTGARDLLPAAANRFGMHLIIDKKRAVEPFLDYAINKGFHRSVIGFLSWKREAIYGDIGNEAAFATPRTWEDVSNILASPIIQNDTVLRNIALGAAVGTEAAYDIGGYLDNEKHLPNWSRIREGDESYEYSIPRGDMCLEFAVATNLAIEILESLRAEATDEVNNLAKLLRDLGDDMLILMFKTLKRDLKVGIRALSNATIKPYWDKVKGNIRA